MADHRLDPDSPVPLPRQLAGILRARIESGELSGRIPSANELALEYSTSRDTSLKSIGILKSEGLITTARGKGSYVVPPDQR
jgi:DNA-binding GntR family transcriptional regulator